MKFFVELFGRPREPIADFPFIILQADRWNDYGYNTLFHVYLVRGDGERPQPQLGSIKVISKNLAKGRPRLPSAFEELPAEFCSLGQGPEYYEKLERLGVQVAREVLAALRDVSWDRRIYKSFYRDKGFELSLLRSPSARAALTVGQRFARRVRGVSKREVFDPSFWFRTTLPEATDSHHVVFDFDRHDAIPRRAAVIVGRNGTGKTAFLGRLGIALSGLSKEGELRDDDIGAFDGEPPSFQRVLAVSYSAFDAFRLPGEIEGAKRLLRRSGEIFGYAYFGLRETTSRGSNQRIRLKSFSELRGEFSRAIRGISARKRLFQWREMLGPIIREGLIDVSIDKPTYLVRQFQGLSSGQKIALLTMTQVLAQIRPNSIVLFDEPETHLHPTLLSACLHSLRQILATFDSVAVISTHSPVVVQETPSRQITVFDRQGNNPIVRAIPFETFGETLGRITSELFEVNAEVTDFHEILEGLARSGRSIQEVERLFGRDLGLNARSYLLGLLKQGTRKRSRPSRRKK